jgi:hypothetical protein
MSRPAASQKLMLQLLAIPRPMLNCLDPNPFNSLHLSYK